MITLYHFPNAICAQKVRVTLAEKRLEWDSKAAASALRSPEYLKLNPGGYVPTLIHKQRVITESRIICEYLNDAFPEMPLMPDEPYARARVGLWTKQIDDTLHLNVHTLSFVTTMQPRYMAMSPEELERALPFDPTKQGRIRDMMKNGVNSRFVRVALDRFVKLIDDLELALQDGPWLVGNTYTLADADLTPYMQRLTDLGLSFLWRDKPSVTNWFERLKARPSFAAVIADWHSTEEIERSADIARKSQPLLERVLHEGVCAESAMS